MGLEKSIKLLLQSKVTLYVVLFVAVTNVLGFLMVNNYEAILFFSLIGYLTTHFSKNMIVVLLTAVVSTNLLLMVVKKNKSAAGLLLEGLDNEDEDDEENDSAGSPEEFTVQKGATGKKMKKMAENMGLDDPKISESMAEVDKLESLINKQEGLMNNLGKVEGLMDRLENFGKRFQQTQKKK